MNKFVLAVAPLILPLIVFPSAASASMLAEITNYRQYSDTFASSGQPDVTQLKAAADSGVKRVIYLAFTDDETAIEHEDRSVKKLGMEYIHIPVDFMAPTLTDFQQFASVMQQAPDTNTLLHCQVNFRASSFSLLYRVIYLDVPVVEAKEAFDSVWQPNEVWFRFIQAVLRHYEIDPACEGCDWGVNEFFE
jgi:protein tyrosine phosphatase (PTP) superfamily phosphohydrolase (DUF442 family)